MRRTLIAVLSTAMVTVAIAGSAVASSALPTLLGSRLKGPDRLLVRPPEIVYTGDSTGILGGFDGAGRGWDFGHLRWTHWNRTRASGHGADWINDCEPDCADGTFTAHEASVNAFRPRKGHFTRLTIHTTYRGRRLVSKLALVKSRRVWIYTILP